MKHEQQEDDNLPIYTYGKAFLDNNFVSVLG